MSADNPIDPIGRSLTWVFVVVIGSFLATSIFARFASSEIASLSNRLATNTSPSIEGLAEVRGSVLQVELALSRLLRAGDATPDRLRPVDDSLAALESAVEQYLVLPLSPGERKVHDQIERAWQRFHEEATFVRDAAVDGDFEGARPRLRRVEAASRPLVQHSMQAIEFNARHGQVLAREIGASRRRTELVSGGLTALSVILGVIGAILLQRQRQRRRAVAEERMKTLEERATELEQFAGRVAHDIRGPLSAASLAVQLLDSRTTDEDVRTIVSRLERSLRRASVITTDLLDFARAGAAPTSGGRTSPSDAIADIMQDLDAEAAKHDIELVWEPLPSALVRCTRGVYLSLLGNLVRNAIKYMGESTTRRIVVSVMDDGAAVRTEVADTGPGIPESQLGSLFEPYFRGNDSSASEGLGLGLATVRKLAEGHGGSVGVSSPRGGSGSTFWFTLPRVHSDRMTS